MFSKYSREPNTHKVDDTFKFCLRQCERVAIDIGYDEPLKLNEHSLDLWSLELIKQVRKMNETGLLILLQLPEA